MLAGELYIANDPELYSEHLRAQAILGRFNATSADAGEERRALLTKLFASFGEGTVFNPTLRCDYGFNIAIGERTFVNFDCVLLDCNRITIGDEVQIAPSVHIYTAMHPIDAKVRRSGFEYALPVLIGDGVWLGGGAIVCPGVTIGEETLRPAGRRCRRRKRCYAGLAGECPSCRQSVPHHTAAVTHRRSQTNLHEARRTRGVSRLVESIANHSPSI